MRRWLSSVHSASLPDHPVTANTYVVRTRPNYKINQTHLASLKEILQGDVWCIQHTIATKYIRKLKDIHKEQPRK